MVAYVVAALAVLAMTVMAAVAVGARRAHRDAAEAHEQRQERLLAEIDSERQRVVRALDALPQGLVITGSQGEVLLRNAAARSFLGDRAGDALVADAVRATARAALDGRTVRRTVEVFGPPRRAVELVAEPFDGGALVAIDDVTEQARLEAVRTDFVANISHELRTPIGALSLLAETLVDETEPEVIARLSEKMVQESNRVARIIEDLLELSRIELGGEPFREPVNVGLIAAEALERVRPLAEARGIRVQVTEPSRRLTVIGDRRQLVSALANLVENGVKYSDTGSVVEVAAFTDGSWVDVVVTDHGIGIPARDLDRIFERFYRVDRARSRETGGTGLGLAIVRHVATNHGGDVRVQSQEGVGSSFTLRIPSGPGPVAVTVPEAG